MEIGRSIRLIWERIDANFAEALATKTPALAPEALFLPAAGLTQALTRHTRLRLYDIPDADLADSATVELAIQDHMLLKQEITLARPQQGLLAPLADRVSAWLTAGDRVVMACRSPRHVRHLAELLEQHRIPLAVRPAPLKPEELRGPAVAELLLYDQPLAEGFELIAERCHILSESELFGEKRLGLKKSSRPRLQPPDQPPMRFDELNSGDIVVHREHGLGVYQGLVTLELQGITNDFLQITYLGEDKLYVPVDRINTVGKYQGLTDKQPKIDRLGGSSWALAKKKVKEAVWQVAQELLELYAKRELRQGRAFSPPAEMFRELEESFPFEETPGQHKAIQEVLDDLISEKPTDRLVCGDVGYGKTEVAVRAAFKVVEDGLQVAVLVPTTVLAEQHAATFRERLQGFPVQVESINRFRSPAEQRRILQELANGTIDIIIGTHRLLSKDIAFKKLGLLVVDEEHRFGVTHKEKIKKLRNEVDILTLSATPIPRTLQMSLLGIRDLSVISTPPEHRRKILTFVARYDDLVIKEAIIRELQRGGQTFLVHNRVQTIYRMAERVTELVPDARVAVAHGQMPGKALEEIMVRFVKKELDVLVCTTIIESGLDITNANTIIINRADRLGLAEIYQLRGRVGRSSEQSYAYLLVPSMDDLSKDAKDRLRALMDCSDLGGGFKLALSDLQIRGGGNLLGVSQSGHITAVGYELYLDLLQKTVMDLKRRAANAEAEREEIEPEINLRLSAFIPAGYINDSGQRYIAYRKIAALATDKEIADLQDELRDRYGALPAETLNLFEIMAVKMTLKRLLITRLEQGKETLVFSFHAQTPVSPQRILELLQKSRETMRFTPDARLVVPLRHPAISPLTVARDLLAALA
ncbi:MAG: transcription-repair coupling factor [Deltaproteobacteria bacterium RIFOXYD12_FULL_57_12]|nr:MAG: transcription-repair coupling factor [Deltaproteobacteria bacterium RIFOXYD12_FULL_57_12]